MSDVRPDRHALLELDALLGELAALRDDGDAARFDQDSRYRWVLHRLWIAVGNEALAYTAATGQRYVLTGPGRTFTTCATTSPTPGSRTSTRDSSGGSPGPASARYEKRSGTISAPVSRLCSKPATYAVEAETDRARWTS